MKAFRPDTVVALLVVMAGLVPVAAGCTAADPAVDTAVPVIATTPTSAPSSRPSSADPPPSSTTPAAPPLLDEDFDGAELDRSVWNTCHWWAPDGCTIETNGELEWYLPEQVAVRDGILHLTAVADPVRADGKVFPFRSGMVSTGPPDWEPGSTPRFAFTYGRVEARVWAPGTPGAWSAVWLLPASRNPLPEIDLLEVYGHYPDMAQMMFHDASGVRHGENHTVDGLTEGWHDVVLDWAPGSLVWSIDGVPRVSVEGDMVPDEPMYLVLNLAVGGPIGGPAPADAYPATFRVDRVRVWAR